MYIDLALGIGKGNGTNTGTEQGTGKDKNIAMEIGTGNIAVFFPGILDNSASL